MLKPPLPKRARRLSQTTLFFLDWASKPSCRSPRVLSFPLIYSYSESLKICQKHSKVFSIGPPGGRSSTKSALEMIHQPEEWQRPLSLEALLVVSAAFPMVPQRQGPLTPSHRSVPRCCFRCAKGSTLTCCAFVVEAADGPTE